MFNWFRKWLKARAKEKRLMRKLTKIQAQNIRLENQLSRYQADFMNRRYKLYVYHDKKRKEEKPDYVI